MRRKKIFFWAFFFLCLLFLGGYLVFFQKKVSKKLSTALSQNLSNYYSYYQEPQTPDYYNTEGAVVEGSFVGFRNQYNLDDPIIRCLDERANCAYPETSYVGSLLFEGRIQPRFRVFVPPGSEQVESTLMLGQPSYYAVVARLGRPPAEETISEAKNLSDSEWRSLPNFGFNLLELKTEDCIGKNSGGFLSVVRDASGDNGIIPPEGAWLYIVPISRSGDVINFQHVTIVNTEKYLPWFRSATWDSAGDPVENIVSATPSSYPTPTPTPTSMSTLPGDIEPVGNPDGDVDIYDYNIFIQNWGKSAVNNPADIDKNGKVDIFDYNLLVGNFGRSV